MAVFHIDKSVNIFKSQKRLSIVSFLNISKNYEENVRKLAILNFISKILLVGVRINIKLGGLLVINSIQNLIISMNNLN